MMHEARIIPLDGRSHLTKDIRQWLGDSRGRWEGNTLVVETTNFNDKTNLRGSTSNSRLIERLTRVNAETIDYKISIDDSSTWTSQWTVEFPLTKTPDRLYEFACHEGNYGMDWNPQWCSRAGATGRNFEEVGRCQATFAFEIPSDVALRDVVKLVRLPSGV